MHNHEGGGRRVPNKPPWSIERCCLCWQGICPSITSLEIRNICLCLFRPPSKEGAGRRLLVNEPIISFLRAGYCDADLFTPINSTTIAIPIKVAPSGFPICCMSLDPSRPMILSEVIPVNGWFLGRAGHGNLTRMSHARTEAEQLGDGNA